MKNNHRTAKLWIQYFEFVQISRLFVRSQRAWDWHLYLFAVKQMPPCFLVCGCMEIICHGEMAIPDFLEDKRRFCGFSVSSLFSWKSLLEAEVNANMTSYVIVLKEGYDNKETTVFFHVCMFYTPMLINDWMALGRLPLLSRYPRKDFCCENARDQWNKYSCCWHRIFRDFTQGNFLLIFFLWEKKTNKKTTPLFST